jgi:hypothetical protein
MRSLFKASLVAAAVVAAGTASAGTLDVTPLSLSQQGAAGADADATRGMGEVLHTVEKGYSVNDEITFTIKAGGTDVAEETVWPATMTYDSCYTGTSTDEAVIAAAITPTCGTGTMVTSLFTSDASGAVYRVNTVTANASIGQTTIGAVATLAEDSIMVKTQDIALGTVELCATSKATNGSQFDKVDCQDLATTENQFGTIVVKDIAGNPTPLDQQISVSSNRLEFTSASADPAVLVDMLTWSATDNTDLADEAEVDETRVVLSGDFGALENDAFKGTYPGAEYTYDDEAKTLTAVYTTDVTVGPATTDTITITPDGVATLKAQSFSIAGERDYGSVVGESIGNNVDAGEWTLDGALVNIPYMPYHDGISQIVYVTNEGSQDGEISGEAFDEAGNVYAL